MQKSLDLLLRMMGDMKEPFQTATNTVAEHNAAMLQEAQPKGCRCYWPQTERREDMFLNSAEKSKQ